MKDNNEIQKFVNDQLSCWPLACANFRALKNVKTKTLNIGGLDVIVQHNPARMISSAAKLDKTSVAKRPCFFCNRFPEQTYIRFEGRKGKKYDILLNPYPIFPDHLVIASTRHCDQSIWKRYIDILDLSRKYQDYTFFYNGPHSGASAPDHHHFQAAPNALMPLENDVRRMLAQVRVSSVKDEEPSSPVPELTYLTSVQDAQLFHYNKFVNGVFVLRAATSKSAAKIFYRLLDCADTPQGESEPLFNLMSWYADGEYCSIVVFRTAHRSHHYFSDGPDHLTMSPGCADMGGCFIAPVPEDFEKLDAKLLTEMLDEVTLSKEAQHKIVRRLTRTQPHISVGIMSAERIEFQMYPDGGGTRVATYREGKIDYDGALYDELFFEEQTPSTFFAEPTFELHDVTIGKGFHWERRETQKFAGALKIIVENNGLTAVNVIGVEDYLLSVISSEMNQNSPEEFLKAHAVISRSWVMAQLAHHGKIACDAAERESFLKCRNIEEVVTWLAMHRHSVGNESHVPEAPSGETEYIRWYDRSDHCNFDVCADDHCQRYQGLTRATEVSVQKAIDATWGQVLTFGGELCDARFSKCCGGTTELFSTCWASDDKAYLPALPDTLGHLPLDTANADGTIVVPFCSLADSPLLARVFNSYDRETTDFYRWTQVYELRELSALVREKSGVDIGELTALEPLAKGASGRIFRLRVVGTKNSFIVGKELEIRRILSPSHLRSSAFDAEFTSDGRVILRGLGWGHGVGLCQIGAAVMADRGYGYRAILEHYYPGTQVSESLSK
ncbi:MAG: DUF4922 domain-containing protein [Candidatus Cryptobacteroides sp.]|nr:DUF4922 domain-containing protein [Bacteroidales bacterium]MDY2774287.1 DUF4922 domain-containing protein [Candidatus Cryptobacteroides sp.]